MRIDYETEKARMIAATEAPEEMGPSDRRAFGFVVGVWFFNGLNLNSFVMRECTLDASTFK